MKVSWSNLVGRSWQKLFFSLLLTCTFGITWLVLHLSRRAILASPRLPRDVTIREFRSPAANYTGIFNLVDLHDNHTNVSRTIRCKAHPWAKHNGKMYIPVDEQSYFMKSGDSYCFTEGLNTNKKMLVNTTKCACLPGWHGDVCSIPDVVQYSNLHVTSKIKPRMGIAPRKIINAFPFNVEFAALETRFAELYDVVDVFLILESNYTAYGDRKPLLLLDRLMAGYYRRYACKIVHVFLDHFPEEGYTNGWAADDILRNYISHQGLQHQLANYSHSDVFLLNDADEIPMREAVLFLKLHDGYPEPIGIHYKKYVYGYFWTGNVQLIQSVVSIGLLQQVLDNKAIYVRAASMHIEGRAEQLNSYLKAYNHTTIANWAFGNATVGAGWHCSWCFPPELVQLKLLAAQNGDFPRWGDDQEKCRVSYIKSLIQKGMWFDEMGTFIATDTDKPRYAPQYLLDNVKLYEDLIVNKYIHV